jgi:hypothetical protein
VATGFPHDDAARVQRAYQLFFARPASRAEVLVAEEYISQAPDRQTAWIATEVETDLTQQEQKKYAG